MVNKRPLLYFLPEIKLPYIFHGHFLSGPVKESLCTLMEKHIETVKGLAALCGGEGKEARTARIVDDVADGKSGVKPGRIRNQAGVFPGSHTDGGGVDEDFAVRELFFQSCFVGKIKKGNGAAALTANPFGFFFHEAGGFRGGAGENGDFPRAVEGGLGQDCRRSASGTEKDGLFSGTADSGVAHRLHKAVAVRIVPEEDSVSVYDSVYGSA